MKRPDTFKRIFELGLIWLLFSAVLWGRIYIGISDAMTAFTVCVDLDAPDTDTLENKLNGCLSDSAGRVEVRPASYFVFGDSPEEAAEVFLIPESKLSDYAGLSTEPVLICDPDSGKGIPAEWLGTIEEKCYLLIGDNAGEETLAAIESFCRLYGGIG